MSPEFWTSQYAGWVTYQASGPHRQTRSERSSSLDDGNFSDQAAQCPARGFDIASLAEHC
jgi:hypothetical protein